MGFRKGQKQLDEINQTLTDYIAITPDPTASKFSKLFRVRRALLYENPTFKKNMDKLASLVEKPIKLKKMSSFERQQISREAQAKKVRDANLFTIMKRILPDEIKEVSDVSDMFRK